MDGFQITIRRTKRDVLRLNPVMTGGTGTDGAFRFDGISVMVYCFCVNPAAEQQHERQPGNTPKEGER
jgi:hypothetical protein